MKAIIETGGKQYGVNVGDVIFVEKLDLDVDKEVVFDKVLMANHVRGHRPDSFSPFLKNR